MNLNKKFKCIKRAKAPACYEAAADILMNSEGFRIMAANVPVPTRDEFIADLKAKYPHPKQLRDFWDQSEREVKALMAQGTQKNAPAFEWPEGVKGQATIVKDRISISYELPEGWKVPDEEPRPWIGGIRVKGSGNR